MTDLDRYLSDPAFANTSLVVLDFEGTTPANHPSEPIEVGAVVLRPSAASMTCARRYEALIQPPAHAPLTAADTRQTGITATMLADRPAAGPVLAALDALLTEPPYVTVAHHAPIEAGILRRYASACPALAAAPMLDTLRLAKACRPRLASYNLDALLTHYEITIPADRHRALADAEVTARLVVRLLAEGANRHGWSQLAQLRSLAGRPPPAAGTAQGELF
ncbi:3'-5' exonuclease [Actinoplanes sp. NPDC026619]|uniref:3'-5' exonuclease n=1 Tax=Actinoplanes sp. NPDC026619 TaxID=3155798 RepID=UPI00340AD853